MKTTVKEIRAMLDELGIETETQLGSGSVYLKIKGA